MKRFREEEIVNTPTQRRVFIRRSRGIWIIIPTIQLGNPAWFAPWEIEFRWLLWGLVICGHWERL